MKKEKISVAVVATKILLVRGKKVMLDRDLSYLYGVTTFNLNKAVKRNIERFPHDFMFRLSDKECADLIFQSGISNWGGRRYLPYVFTEQGVAMLSSVLHSKRAVQVNIAIMRAFVKMRELLLTHKDLTEKIEALHKQVGEHDEKITIIFEAIKQLLLPAPDLAPEKPKIGFR